MTMAARPMGQFLRNLTCGLALMAGVIWVVMAPVMAAPLASHVMDARTGETLFENNADTKLHPASLTKMLTLYIAFEEIERGNLSLDSMITVSKNAAAQPPSRLGLKAGQKIQLRFLIRAAAIKSANDAAQAIGDAIGGNQAQFAERMNRTARALGMRNSTFKNASGLTAKGHLSTAKDMSILGRHLFYDFPQYYNIFSRRQTNAGLADVANTNRKFLDAYKGADGIKTGYTQAAGFNLTASAERRNVRLIATQFGAESTADRNAKVAKLLDKGFDKAKRNVDAVPPSPPQYLNADDELIATMIPDDGLPEGGIGASAKTLRAVLALTSSPRPMPRPDMSVIAEGAEELVAEMADSIAGALAEVTMQASSAPDQPVPFAVVAPEAATPQTAAPENAKTPVSAPLQPSLAAMRPAPRPKTALPANTALPDNAVQIQPAAPVPQMAQTQVLGATPTTRQAPIYDDATILASAAPLASPAPPSGAGEAVTRLSTSGGHHWGVNIGRFSTSDAAERILVKTQLVESATLGQSLRKVTQKGGGFDANFLGLSEEQASLACRRLTARGIPCTTLGP